MYVELYVHNNMNLFPDTDNTHKRSETSAQSS